MRSPVALILAVAVAALAGRLLVEAGADVDIPDGDGATALDHARHRGFTEIERLLRDAA